MEAVASTLAPLTGGDPWATTDYMALSVGKHHDSGGTRWLTVPIQAEE